MAWCRQAASHYLNQCWPRSMSPYGVTRPQRVKTVNDVGIHNQEGWDLHNKVNIMSADDLEMQGARSSASMALTKLAWNMLLPKDVGTVKNYSDSRTQLPRIQKTTTYWLMCFFEYATCMSKHLPTPSYPTSWPNMLDEWRHWLCASLHYLQC